MTTAAELVRRARSLGAKLWAEGERLELDAPADFPDKLIDVLREHKPEVLVYLCQQPAEELALPETAHLLAWASELAEQDVVLSNPVSYVEAPLRTVTTGRVSWYAAHYLRTITSARIGQETGGWGQWTPEWWREREEEAICALTALRQALAQQESAEEKRA